MAETERTYIIPLRRVFLKVPKYRRAKRTIAGVRSFLEKHMKSDQVKLGMSLNDYIWERGMQNPPHKVKVTVKKDDKGVVHAELFGTKAEEKKTGEKKAQKEQKPQKKGGEELREKATTATPTATTTTTTVSKQEAPKKQDEHPKKKGQ